MQTTIFFQLVNETSGKNKVVNLLNNSSDWNHHKRSNGFGAQSVIAGATGPGSAGVFTKQNKVFLSMTAYP